MRYFISYERVPRNAQKRQIWVDIIKKHQKFSNNQSSFNVCIRHFDKGETKWSKGRICLIENALPTIFTSTMGSKTIEKSSSFRKSSKSNEANEVPNDQNLCDRCTQLENTIRQMQIKMLHIYY